MSIQTPARAATLAGVDRATVSRAGAIGAASILAAAGLVLVALGAAFPLALGVIEQQGLRVPASDLALAERIAPLWWAFVAAGAAHLAAAFAALDGGALARRIALVVTGIGIALTGAAEVALTAGGATAVIAGVVASVYLLALIGVLVTDRRVA
jgi:hypothetical protein